jgi:hypothetical protein
MPGILFIRKSLNDYLAEQTKPSVVPMNPPFSASPCSGIAYQGDN